MEPLNTHYKSVQRNPLNRLLEQLRRLGVTDQSQDHSVEVEEEHHQVETQLDEALLLVLGQGSEDLSSVQHMVLLQNLVSVVGKQRRVQQKHKPVSIDKEENSHDGVKTSLRNKPWVQLVTQLNWVDVVALQVGVHNGEENLREQVKCVDDNGKDKQPAALVDILGLARCASCL